MPLPLLPLLVAGGAWLALRKKPPAEGDEAAGQPLSEAKRKALAAALRVQDEATPAVGRAPLTVKSARYGYTQLLGPRGSFINASETLFAGGAAGETTGLYAPELPGGGGCGGGCGGACGNCAAERRNNDMFRTGRTVGVSEVNADATNIRRGNL